ncbi:hypothetical protein ACFLYU_01320 [Candidatus Dependentiae bacterium]
MSLVNPLHKKNIFSIIIFLFLLSINNFIKSRSILRKSYQRKPKITVWWTNKPATGYAKINSSLNKNNRATKNTSQATRSGSKKYSIASTQLEIDPIFKTFDKDFFYKNMLPEKITHRYDINKHTIRQELEQYLEHLFTEIRDKERRYTHFDILRKSNFNRRKRSGLLILKFKNYPFVVKVFMENPKNFVRPYSKGFYPIFFFNMGGGINRHLLGFTRVKNLHNIKKILAQTPKWTNEIETPRKWYWIPKNSKNIELIGTNFIADTEIKTIIPGTYCVIADAIRLKHSTFSLFDKEARKKCMSLCNSLGTRIDPHIDNFLLEKKTNKLVIIDTEHFPSIVGLQEGEQFENYFSWYYRLAIKCLNDMFFKTKKERYKKI